MVVLARPFVPALGCLLLVAASQPALAQMVTLSPEQIGEVFCIARLGNDMAPVEGLLTADLKTAIATAESQNAAIQAQAPDDKPPLGDGIPWQSWPDYAPVCTVGQVGYMMDEASVAIAYSFPDAPDAGFTDKLWLVLVETSPGAEKVWRIDNLVYGTDSDLKQTLSTAFLPN